jgi:membrane protein implicated in regulation of membrane protease activity
MNSNIRLLDVVALTADIPEKSLLRGQVGTVVEIFTDGQYEVEFADEEGRTYALEPFDGERLMVLRYRPEKVA